MSKLTQNQRVLIVVTLLTLSFTALACRLVQLQVLRRSELNALAQANRELVVHRQGRRGEIRDVGGNLLANSQSVRIVYADQTITSTNALKIATKLAPLLQMDTATLVTKLSGTSKYIRLKQKVDEDTAANIRALKLRGIGMEDQFVRTYPGNTLASHVLGFVDNNHKGVQGIEASMDEYLAGITGYEVIERDRKGREIRVFREEGISPRDGLNVVLTIDQVIQHIAETELDKAVHDFHAQAGVIIVTRPKTGEILAMSSRPTFNLNKVGDAEADTRRNRCISDVAEPGSTFKIVVASGAMNEGLITLSDRFDCENGAWLYGKRVLHDAHPYGILSVEDILVKSSNIGAAKIAVQRLGASRLADYIRRYGFGRRTGIALPAEVSGITRPLAKWDALSVTRIPMGHEIAATPLQMIMAMNAIANGGRLMKPMIVKSIVNPEGAPVITYQPQQLAQVITPRATGMMTTALSKVPALGGTAPKAAVKGFDVAGKTGTAQKIENGQYVRKYYSSFIGYLPARDPEISILVSLDNPTGGSYYGGTVSGPAFREVASKVAEYLGIPPQFAVTNETKVAHL